VRGRRNGGGGSRGRVGDGERHRIQTFDVEVVVMSYAWSGGDILGYYLQAMFFVGIS
jgi:hypothetical protein